MTSDGNLHVRARSDGAELDRISLGILPDGGLLQAGKQVLVSAGGGRFVPWRPCSAPPASRESSDRKAGSVKRLVYSFALALVDGFPGHDRGRVLDASRRGTGGRRRGKTTDQLLRAVPFDRVTLIDGTVLIVDPVSPRPLPTYDPAKEREKKRRREKNVIPLEGNIIVGVPDQARDAERRRRKSTPNGLDGRRRQAASAARRRQGDRRLQGEAGEHQEDRVFRGHAARGVRSSGRAPRLHAGVRVLLRVQTRNPGWHGLVDRVNRVLFAEGSKALIDGDGERGLRLLRELLARKRDYPGLLDQIGEAYSKRIERALTLGLYPRGRRVLHELEELVPEHILVKQMRALFVTKATDASSVASRRRHPSGSTRWPRRCGSGRPSTESSRFTTRRSAKSRRSKWR